MRSRDPVEIMRQEYLRRKERNPLYSMRGFAKFLGVPSGRLSEIFSRKRPISNKLLYKITERIGLSPEETKSLYQARQSKLKSKQTKMPIVYQALPEDEFRLIADWYHYAILSLVETTDFQSSPQWIRSRLGLEQIQVESAVERLFRLGLLRVDPATGKWQRRKGRLTTTHDVPSSALRKSHKVSIERAVDALEAIDVTSRDITSMTLSFDPEDMPKAKKLLKKFRREFMRQMQSSNKVEVYELNLQLLPITRRIK